MKPPVLRSTASRPEESTGYEAAGFPLFGFAPGGIDGHEAAVSRSSASRPEESTGYEAAGSPLFGFAP
ncbi:hypothetical protein ACVNS2_30670 [Paenibacillus caseinilyticus]|uniref:Uncharacterized protein n=1 Tax=Paenibacillus mucilaginosus K02 TaxID=997761 RepID=R9ULX0_9BACL|nr:hypothetical protein [Paenibacillus mucilaginosus]AGN70791.1 hypothetical protein B2K_40145 [Paenibacillus mucilaginosus K02]